MLNLAVSNGTELTRNKYAGGHFIDEWDIPLVPLLFMSWSSSLLMYVFVM